MTPSTVSIPPPAPGRKWSTIALLGLVELLAMGLWFSASAVLPQLTEEWALGAASRAGLTVAVQLGFVVGAFLSAVTNLADRLPLVVLVAASAAGGAAANAALAAFATGPAVAMGFRFLTGMALAGVYPPGMKIVATWCRGDLGLGIGLLVGALTFGKSLPHLLNAAPVLGEGGMPPWRSVVYATSALAAVASFLGLVGVRTGPYLRSVAPFDWRFVGRVLAYRPTRLANFGYLGHMWELYSMWAWVPILLLASYESAGWSVTAARLAGFGAIAAGAFGCVAAGAFADRWGRTAVTSWSLALSGSCALLAGFLYDRPAMLTALCLVWGFAVVADSAQFSAAVTELTDARFVGTALTLQTSLGFLLTTLTLELVPALVAWVGWHWALAVLALGPAFGLWCMLRLRRLPEAVRMASGRR